MNVSLKLEPYLFDLLRCLVCLPLPPSWTKTAFDKEMNEIKDEDEHHHKSVYTLYTDLVTNV